LKSVFTSVIYGVVRHVGWLITGRRSHPVSPRQSG